VKIQKYNQFNEAQKMTSLHQPTDDEIKDAEEYLEKGIDSDWDYKNGYFFIDITGRYSVYYTLWKISPLDSHFITNLSTDFQTAVQKAKKATGRIPVLIDRTGTKAGLFQAAKDEIVTFGTHRGETLGDIFATDPQYIVWLSKKYKGNTSLKMDRIKYYRDLYYETITKKNQEESKSKWVGKKGDEITITADIYDFKIADNPYNNQVQYECRLKDEDGNKYMTYNIGKKLKNGDSVKLKAKVKDHKEYLGVKFTQIFYCKVIDVWNREEDMNKFNL
jgi:hypothetical protein